MDRGGGGRAAARGIGNRADRRAPAARGGGGLPDRATNRVAAYMGWFHHTRGQYALTDGDGAFLYSRVMAFADCAKMNPPARLRPLCDNRPPSRRPVSA